MKFQGTQIVAALPVFKGNLSEYEKELTLAIEAAHLLKENVPAMESNVKSQYVSPYNSHKLEPKLKPLCDLAVKSCNFVAGSISPVPFKFYVDNCWVAFYEPNDSTNPHNHWPFALSCVIYLDIDEDGAPLVFEGRTEIKPNKNDIIIFPGWVTHEVPRTSGKRLVVAMNLTLGEDNG